MANGSGFWLDEAQSNQLNELGSRIPPKDEQNKSAFLAWRNDVWCFLYDHLMKKPTKEDDILPKEWRRREDAINNFAIKLERFDPAKGLLSNYATKSLKHLFEHKNKAVEPDNDNDRPLESSDEDGRSVIETVAAPGTIDDPLVAEPRVQQMAAMILNFKQIYHGKKGNPAKQTYYRMWFTEKSKNIVDRGFRIISRGDVLRALNYGYLDYFLQGDFSRPQNRTWPYFVHAEPKPPITVSFSDMPVVVEWNSKDWLPAMIPRGYIGQETGSVPSDSTVSEQRDAYLNDLRVLLRENEVMA